MIRIALKTIEVGTVELAVGIVLMPLLVENVRHTAWCLVTQVECGARITQVVEQIHIYDV
jgi:hypothetical protein